MNNDTLFVKNYNKENNLIVKDNLDIYDECDFSFLDILKEKEVEIVSKVEDKCKCTESVNFNVYYDKCNKCLGSGKLLFNCNEVICNHCHGKKMIVKNLCPLCKGEGKIIKKGIVRVKLNNKIKNGDVLTLVGYGKERNGVKGNLYIKVRISDIECFKVENNDVYDKRIIFFNKDDIAKDISKVVETIKGEVKVKSSKEEVYETVRLENQGIDNGNFYVCLHNDLIEIKGKDAFKNILIDKNKTSFYIKESELESDAKCLKCYYFKPINDEEYRYIELEDVNNFKIFKLKENGLKGKNGGLNGDLYLRVFFNEDFKNIDDKLYSYPIKLNKYEINDGKKVLELNKSKINLIFEKKLVQERIVEVDDYGFMINKNDFDKVNFIVNPCEYEVYKVSVKVNKKDKVIYLKDYKKYFYETVSLYNDGLKVILNKKNENVVFDELGNKVIVKVIK